MLAGFSAGAVAYAFLFTRIGNEKQCRQAACQTIKADRNRPSRRQGLPRPRGRSHQAPQVGAGFAEGTRREAEVQGPQRQEAAADACRSARPACRSPSSASMSIRSICGLVLDARRSSSPARRCSCCPARLLAGAFGLPRWFVGVPPQPPHQAIPQRIPQRPRRHRARGQVRPAAQRRHPPDRQRTPEPVHDRVPPHRRGPADGHFDPRCRAAHDRDDALPGGELLRHRHPDPAARPAAISPRRSAIFRACCATARR